MPTSSPWLSRRWLVVGVLACVCACDSSRPERYAGACRMEGWPAVPNGFDEGTCDVSFDGDDVRFVYRGRGRVTCAGHGTVSGQGVTLRGVACEGFDGCNRALRLGMLRVVRDEGGAILTVDHVDLVNATPQTDACAGRSAESLRSVGSPVLRWY